MARPENLDGSNILPTATWLATRFTKNSRFALPEFFCKGDIDGINAVVKAKWEDGCSEITIETPQLKEEWKINERYSNLLVVSLQNLLIGSNVNSALNLRLRLTFGGMGLVFPNYAISFKDEFNLDWNDCLPSQPEDYPVRTIDQIDYTAMRYAGKEDSTKEAVNTLIRIRDLIANSEPIL